MTGDLLNGLEVPWNFIIVADTPESALEPPIDWRRPPASSYNGVIHQYPTILEALGLVALIGVTARDLGHQIADNLRRRANR